jgi:hypothetical protein
MIQSHERNIKQFSAAYWDDFVQPKSLSAIFQSPEDDLWGLDNSDLKEAGIALSLEGDFM